MKDVGYKIGHNYTLSDAREGLIVDVITTRDFIRLKVVGVGWTKRVKIRRQKDESAEKPTTCYKIFWYSKEAAEKRLADIMRQNKKHRCPQSVYLCPFCKRYHLTSKKQSEQ